MTKARRMMEDKLGRADVVLEVLDARIPRSSRNPDFDDLFGEKKRIAVLNKADLADPAVTKRWTSDFNKAGIPAVAVNASSSGARKRILACLKEVIEPEAQRLKEKKGIRKTACVMVAGIPNVGKSTLINCLSGSGSTKTGNKPGMTRGNQIVRITPYLELMDTPGLLWPKLDDEQGARYLAFTGAIKDEIMDTHSLCLHLLGELVREYPDNLAQRYKLDADILQQDSPEDILQKICRKRGFIGSGGVPDEERGAATVVNEFRSGKLGAISLERPGGQDEEDIHG